MLSVFAAADDAPDAPALISDRQTLSYAGLADAVRPAVGWLRDRRLEGDAPVGVVAGTDVPTIVLLHALVATATPVLLLHPRHTTAEREALARSVDAAAIVDPTRPRGRPPPDGDPAPPPADERPLAIVPTSGTSGRPKGVVLPRRAFAAAAAASAANLGWRPDDRWVLVLPLAHVGGLSILTRCLLARRAIVLAEDAAPDAIMGAIERHRATLVSLVPTMLSRILSSATPPPGPPASLRAVLLGGAAATPALLGTAADAGWPVLTTYGMTEACSQATTQRYGTVNRGGQGSGPPLPGVELRIGEGGTIQLRGPTLFSGYRPGEDDPFLRGGWFDTGDRGRTDDEGNLHVLGRREDRIVTGGENVDPVEVEGAVEALPAVRSACVFGVPDPEWGEVVAVAVVPAAEYEARRGASLDDAIRAAAAALAPFKRPRLIAEVDAVPLNANGKVDRVSAARLATPRLRRL
jgi:O-succinylbenzoic acid--CoA ligase